MENRDTKNLDSNANANDKGTSIHAKQNHLFWWAFGVVSVICALLFISALVIANDSKERSAQMILVGDATSDVVRTGLLQKIQEQALANQESQTNQTIKAKQAESSTSKANNLESKDNASDKTTASTAKLLHLSPPPPIRF